MYIHIWIFTYMCYLYLYISDLHWYLPTHLHIDHNCWRYPPLPHRWAESSRWSWSVPVTLGASHLWKAVAAGWKVVMLVQQCHKPSPKHHKWVVYTIENGWFMTLLYPHYATWKLWKTPSGHTSETHFLGFQVASKRGDGSGRRLRLPASWHCLQAFRIWAGVILGV